MLFFLLFIIALCLYQWKHYGKGQWNINYLNIESTVCIKGIFLLFVFGAHYLQYVKADGILDQPYLLVNGFLGQGIVVMFLFYSGYGVYESIKIRGWDYIKNMPQKRIWPTIYHFWIAVLIYLMTGTMIGKEYSLEKILLAFTGWVSVGNSNWYIFAVFWCYLFTWAAFGLFQQEKLNGLRMVTLLTVGYILIMMQVKQGEWWWYNTILVYPMGMWFAFYRVKIESLVCPGMRHDFSEGRVQTESGGASRRYFFVMAAALTATVAVRPFTDHLSMYLLWSLLFAFTVLLLTMKVSVGNTFLSWMGRHTFEIYIMQRLPMMLLKYFRIHRKAPYLFGILSFTAMLILAAGFHQVLKYVDSKLVKTGTL